MAAKRTTPKVQEAEQVTVIEPVPPKVIRTADGDNYLTVARRFGIDANVLFELNGGMPIRPGTLLRLS